MNWAKPNKTHDEKPTAVLLGVTAVISQDSCCVMAGA